MWSFGYTDYIGENHPIDVMWGESSRFTDAVTELFDNVTELAAKCDSYQDDHYAAVLSDISDIMLDPAYREDPDQWEDMAFHDEMGEIEYYVTQS